MTSAPPPLDPAAVPVAEIERRLRWRLLPVAVFIALLAALAMMAISSLAMHPAHPHGVPSAPAAEAAVQTLTGRVSLATDSLRLAASVFGGEVPDRSPDADAIARMRAARTVFEPLHRAHMNEPLALAAMGALELSEHRHERAIAAFRRACETAPHYGEARLGAGVSLALLANITSEPWQARALRLQAAAQFAMVDSTDDVYPLALYDRTRVLRDAGRSDEARFYARRFLAREPAGVWADALRRDVLGS